MISRRFYGLQLVVTSLSVLVAGGAAADSPPAAAEPARPPEVDLLVRAVGFTHHRGHAIAKLFRLGQSVTGPAFATLRTDIRSSRALFEFRSLRPGAYALVVFHDENDNRTIDHGMFGHGIYGPIEPIAFSNGYRLSLLSLPSFDKLKFNLTPEHNRLEVTVQ